ncbi:MAG TPA: hypothetical protein VMT32_15730 [Bryobacteraceae bacterium]|nr:hypothetical protein [Bryobacteraceae bacterium]
MANPPGEVTALGEGNLGCRDAIAHTELRRLTAHYIRDERAGVRVTLDGAPFNQGANIGQGDEIVAVKCDWVAAGDWLRALVAGQERA